MIIKTGTGILKAVSTLSVVISDRLLTEDIKNIIFKINSDSSVYIAAYATSVTCFVEVEGASVDWQGTTPEETYFQVKSEIVKLLDTYKALSKTAISEIEIIPAESFVTLNIHEISKSGELHEYDKISKHRLASPVLTSGIKERLEQYELSFTGEELSSKDFLLYLDALIPTLDSRDNRDNMKIAFTDEKIYTAPALYFALLDNKLGSACSGYMLNQTSAKFLKTFLTQADVFEISKAEKFIKIKCGTSVAFVHTFSLKTAINYQDYANHTQTGITLDKKYMQDVIKRIYSDNCTVKIRISDVSASCSFATENWKQDIGVLKSCLVASEFPEKYLSIDESGNKYLDIAFSIRPDILSRLLMLHTKKFEDLVNIYFEPSGMNGFKMAVADSSGLWQTKINTLSSAKTGVLS